MIEAGQILSNQHGGKWKIGNKIGSGTCCQVFEGKDILDKSQVALKVYNKGLKYDCAHQREYLLLKIVKEKLDEVPQLVQMKGVSHYGNQLILVEEFLKPSLPEIIFMAKEQSHLSLFLIKEVVHHVTRGLYALHLAGFVHADLKPDNIMWSAQCCCFKLIDFGLSFHKHDRKVGLVQSSSYRAPEVDVQHPSYSMPGTAIDVWSLGILIVNLITDKKFSTYRTAHGVCDACKKMEEPCENKKIVSRLFQDIRWHDDKYSLDVMEHIVSQCLLCEAQKRPTCFDLLQFTLPSLKAGFLDLLLLPTCVVQVMNIIESRHLESEEELKDIKEEILKECNKLGDIIKCVIPLYGPGFKKVYIQYVSHLDSASAFTKLNGRSFNGRTVITNYFLQEDFDQKNYF